MVYLLLGYWLDITLAWEVCILRSWAWMEAWLQHHGLNSTL